VNILWRKGRLDGEKLLLIPVLTLELKCNVLKKGFELAMTRTKKNYVVLIKLTKLVYGEKQYKLWKKTILKLKLAMNLLMP
jgi:hypothetical protein